MWDRRTGEPLGNALVWQDTRVTEYLPRYVERPGVRVLPVPHGPAAFELLQQPEDPLDSRPRSPGARALAESGDALFGNIDTFLVWHLTGGPDGGLHVTDVTNASRTQLMNLDTLDWDAELLAAFEIPRAMLPLDPLEQRAVWHGDAPSRSRVCRSPASSATSRRRSSARPASAPARPRTRTVPAASCCSTPASRRSAPPSGLLTTVAYRMGTEPARYALEGSIAVTGRARAVGARQPRADPAQLGDRSAGAHRAGQRRRLLRAGLLRALRAPLERRRPRDHRRPDALRQSRAHRPRRARGDRVSNVGSAAGDGKGLRRQPRDAARRWRHDRRRAADAVPGRHRRPCRGAADESRRRPRWARPSPRDWRSARSATADDLRARWAESHRWQPQMQDDARQQMLRRWTKAVSRSLDWMYDGGAVAVSRVR